jgi:hypothetical protein
MLGGDLEKNRGSRRAARKVFARRPQHNDADHGIGVERLECHAQLLALPHRDHAQRWPVEDDVAAFASGVDFNAKPVEIAVTAFSPLST